MRLSYHCFGRSDHKLITRGIENGIYIKAQERLVRPLGAYSLRIGWLRDLRSG